MLLVLHCALLSLALSTEAEISDREKPEVAAKAIMQMKSTLKKLLRARSDAKDDKDAIKANCVEEKFVQVKGLLQVGQQFETQLSEALARKDKEEGDRAFEKLSIAARKTGELAAEATSCIGESAVFSGDTVVEFENHGAESNEDEAAPKLNIVPMPRPPQVSPYQ